MGSDTTTGKKHVDVGGFRFVMYMYPPVIIQMHPDAWATPMAMEFPPPCVYEFSESDCSELLVGYSKLDWFSNEELDAETLEVEIGSVIYVRLMFRDLFRTVSGWSWSYSQLKSITIL